MPPTLTITIHNRMVLLPLLEPRLDAIDVALHLLRRVALELHHDPLLVRVPRFLEQHLHDLRV